MFTRLGLPMNRYTISFFHAFAHSADFEFQLILYLGPTNFGSEIVLLIPLDISYDQIFLQRSTQNFEIRRRVSRVKKNWRNSKRTHTHLSLSLSLLVDPSMPCLLWRACTSLSLSLSLSLYLQTRFGSKSDPKGIQDRMFRQFKNVCMQ